MSTTPPASPNYWSYIRDGLALLVLPLLAWGVKLEINVAIQQESMNRLEQKVAENETAMKNVEQTVRGNSLQLVKLDSKMDSMSEKVDDIKGLLQKDK